MASNKGKLLLNVFNLRLKVFEGIRLVGVPFDEVLTPLPCFQCLLIGLVLLVRGV